MRLRLYINLMSKDRELEKDFQFPILFSYKREEVPMSLVRIRNPDNLVI